MDVTVIILGVSLFLTFATAVIASYRYLIRNAAADADRQAQQRAALDNNTKATNNLTTAFEAFEEKTGTRLNEAEMKIAVMQQAIWPGSNPYRKNDGGPE